MSIEAIITALVALISIGGGIYGIQKFLLRDIHIQLDLIEKHFNLKLTSIDQHIIETKQQQMKMDQQILESNKRMDGVYNILIKGMKAKTDP